MNGNDSRERFSDRLTGDQQLSYWTTASAHSKVKCVIYILKSCAFQSISLAHFNALSLNSAHGETKRPVLHEA